MIDKNTQLFFSIAEYPGNFGATFFNKAFEYYEINAIYKPIKLDRKFINFINFSRFLEHMKYVGVSAISISMPFKKVAYLESGEHDKDVQEIKNANSLVYLEEKMLPRAHNTDCCAFGIACSKFLNCASSVVVLGTGCVSESIQHILKKWNRNFVVVKNLQSLPDADFFINATPIGMDGFDDSIFTENLIDKFKFVFDVVPKEETKLLTISKKLGKQCVSGREMQLYNAIIQFKLYVGYEVDNIFLENFKNG